MNSDAGDLPVLNPDACQALTAPTGDSALLQRSDQTFFDLPKKQVKVGLVLVQVVDGIAHQLTGTVEGDVASSLDFEEFDTSRCEFLGWSAQVFFLKRSSQCHHGRVLHQQQHVVGHPSVDARLCQRSLQGQRFSIRHTAQSHHEEVAAHSAAATLALAAEYHVAAPRTAR